MCNRCHGKHVKRKEAAASAEEKKVMEMRVVAEITNTCDEDGERSSFKSFFEVQRRADGVYPVRVYMKSYESQEEDEECVEYALRSVDSVMSLFVLLLDTDSHFCGELELDGANYRNGPFLSLMRDTFSLIDWRETFEVCHVHKYFRHLVNIL